MTKALRIAIMAGSLLSFGTAFAKGAVPKQNHHCKLADGSMDMGKTKAQCKAAKGTWAKDAPAAEAKPAEPAPAPAPAEKK